MSQTAAAAIPATVAEFNRRKSQFHSWLCANGSAPEALTNPNEVCRFQAEDGVAVIYSKANGALTYVYGAADAMYCFLTSTNWRGCTKKKRPSGGAAKRLHRVRSIAARDGWSCAFCGRPIDEETASLEHFIPLTQRGPNNLANLLLAHVSCNNQANHLSAREKIELIVAMRRHPLGFTRKEPPHA